jgi:hypothetical protein
MLDADLLRDSPLCLVTQPAILHCHRHAVTSPGFTWDSPLCHVTHPAILHCHRHAMTSPRFTWDSPLCHVTHSAILHCHRHDMTSPRFTWGSPLCHVTHPAILHCHRHAVTSPGFIWDSPLRHVTHPAVLLHITRHYFGCAVVVPRAALVRYNSATKRQVTRTLRERGLGVWRAEHVSRYGVHVTCATLHPLLLQTECKQNHAWFLAEELSHILRWRAFLLSTVYKTSDEEITPIVV